MKKCMLRASIQNYIALYSTWHDKNRLQPKNHQPLQSFFKKKNETKTR